MVNLDAAIHSATQFLLTACDSQGWWRDFRLAPGSSDEWVTAYIGLTLASLGTRPANIAALRGWRLLAARRSSSSGWGYNAFPPPDADSTLWALSLAQILGCAERRQAKQGYDFLKQHIHPDGGVMTYADHRPIRQFIGAVEEISFSGWCAPHVCVTAAAAQLPEFHTVACNFLRGAQEEDGHWASYWWAEDEYATALAVEALARSGDSSDQTRIQRATQWMSSRVSMDGWVSSSVQPSGSPFATALAVRALIVGDDSQAKSALLNRAIRWLLQQQQPNGAWRPSAGLRVPFPNCIHPQKNDSWVVGGLTEGGISLDLHGVFTTATVLQALNTRRNHAE
ncbi:MAG: prenyltransferase/squalene oxidase repeat-containing protein [Chloroflexota bacterium]